MPNQYTIQRLSFEKHIICTYTGSGRQEEYVKRFFGKAKPAPSLMGSEGGIEEPKIAGSLQELTLGLLMGGLDYDKGPYADKSGALARLGKEMLSDMPPDEGKMGIIERIIDRARPFDGSPAEQMLPRRNPFLQTSMRFEACRLASTEGLPTAGAIAADPLRRDDDGTFFQIHPSEPYVLATALLRLNGINAYPARVFNGEEYMPLIVATDLEGSPITTFSMLRCHPDIGHIDIFTDHAMMGVLHAMKAVNLANRLGTDSVMNSLKGTNFTTDEVEARLSEIAQTLLGYCTHWMEPGEEKDILLFQALDAIMEHIAQAEGWKGSRRVLSALPTNKRAVDLFMASRGVPVEAPLLPMNKEHHGMLLEMDKKLLEIYPALSGQLASAWLKAQATARSTADVIQDMLRENLESIQSSLESGIQ